MRAGHRGQPGQDARVLGVRVQVHGPAVLGGEAHHGLGVARRVGIGVRTAADDVGAQVHGFAEQDETVGARGTGERPGHGHGGHLGEPAEGAGGLQHGFERREARGGRDAHLGTQCGGSVAELEKGGLGGAAPDVTGVRARVLGDGGERGVAVGMRLGRGREQEVAAQVQAGAPGGEAAGLAHRFDVPSDDPDVGGPPVGEPDTAEQEGGSSGTGRAVVGPPWPAVGHRAPGGDAGSVEQDHVECARA